MIRFSAQRCKELCEQIATGDNVACSELLEHVKRNKITPTAQHLLAENVNLLTKKAQHVRPLPSWLLFLQGIQSIYQRDFSHPRTLELLTTAYENGHTSAGALLAFYYSAPDSAIHVGRGETWAAKFFRFKHYFQKRNPRLDEKKSDDLLRDLLAKEDVAAMLLSAHTLTWNNQQKLKNNRSPLLDERPFEDIQLEDYKKAYQLFDRAIALGSVGARYKRAVIFLLFRQKTKKKFFLPNYGIEETIHDLDMLITKGHVDAMRWRVILAGGDASYSCFPDVKKDDVLVAYLVRKIHQLNADESQTQREWDEKVLQGIWHKEHQQEKNMDYYRYHRDLRIKYHYWMSKSEQHTIYSQISYVSYLWNIPLQDKRLTQLLQTMINDNIAPEKLKFYLLKDIIQDYAEQLEKFSEQALPEHYELFQQVLHIMEGIAPDDKAFEFIIENCEKIPLTTVAGLRAQMQIADLYFNELLNTTEGKERNALIDVIQNCHVNATTAHDAVMKDCPCAGLAFENEWQNYKNLIEKREALPVFVKPTIVETVKKGLFRRIVDWFINLFVSNKAAEVKSTLVTAGKDNNCSLVKNRPDPIAGVLKQPVIFPFIFSGSRPSIFDDRMKSKNPIVQPQLKI